MAHDIAPGKQHAIINLSIALLTTCGDTAADGLNELLRAEIGEGFIADYAMYNTDEPKLAIASDDPAEGELFSHFKPSLVSVQVVNVSPTHDCLAIVNGKLIMNTDGVEGFDKEAVFDTAERMARALNVPLKVVEYQSAKPELYFDDVMAELRGKGLIPM